MRLIDYQCAVCGLTKEIDESYDATRALPEHCGKPMKRLFKPTTPILKGPGFTGAGKDWNRGK